MQITDKDQTTLGLLFNETPLLIRKELAVRLGLNEAIVLQQVHFHIQNKYKSVKEKDRADDRAWHEGTFWTYNTYEEWQENDFPFWSVRTLKRVFKKMEDDGVLRSGKFNKMKTDQTKWYTINYEKLLTEVTAENVDTEQSDNLAPCAVEQSDNLAPTIVTTWHEPTGQLGTMLPKNPLEVSKDSSSSIASRDLIDSELRSKYNDKPFDDIKEALLADESAIIETDRQYTKLLDYRLKNYKAKKQFTVPTQPKKRKSTRTEQLPGWFDEEDEAKQPVVSPTVITDLEAKKASIAEKLASFRS